MELRFDPELETFRRDIRAFIDAVLPPEMRERQHTKVLNNATVPDQNAWMRILDSHGRSVPHWPVEFGGCGWSPMQLFIFNEELYAADAPEFDWGGTHMLGPVLYTYGSTTLQDRFLPMIRQGETNWAQGFSEPGSGSDLASLRTFAELVGDSYVVNGQKIWTSGASHCGWGFFLVRTDKTVKPQRGISMLIIKMDSPGVTVREIPQINGDSHLCEVFLENVEVPADQLIGEPGLGWTYAKFLLEHERTTSSFIYWSKRRRTPRRGSRPISLRSNGRCCAYYRMKRGRPRRPPPRRSSRSAAPNCSRRSPCCRLICSAPGHSVSTKPLPSRRRRPRLGRTMCPAAPPSL